MTAPTRSPCPCCSTLHLLVCESGVPESIRAKRRWVCWKLEQSRKGKPKKVPIDSTGSWIDPHKSATWRGFDDVLLQHDEGKACGIGYVFARADEMTGVDLDRHVDSNGVLDKFSSGVITALDSYTEYSVSGTGVHTLALGTLPGRGARNDEIGLEIYSDKRYFVVTGHRLPSFPATINERQKEILGLYETHRGRSVASESDSKDQRSQFIKLSVSEVEQAKRLIPSMSAKLESLIQFGGPLYRDWYNPSQIGAGSTVNPNAVDLHVVGCLDARNWSPVEIAAGVFVIRGRYASDPEKALRPDYVPRTISRVRISRKDVPANPDKLLGWKRQERLGQILLLAADLLKSGANQYALGVLTWASDIAGHNGEFFAAATHLANQLSMRFDRVVSPYQAKRAVEWLLKNKYIELTGRTKRSAPIYRLTLPQVSERIRNVLAYA